MESTLPKQFLLLKGLPVLMHTITKFAKNGGQLYVVLPDSHTEYWQQLCASYHFYIPHRLVVGGSTRYHSVKNALDKIDIQDALVAVHDAARPLLTERLVDEMFVQAQKCGNAVPAIQLNDSIRQKLGAKYVSKPRKDFVLIQTPQVFHYKELMAAYQLNYQENFTDDASVVEATGMDINVFPGEELNFKITTTQDLKRAEFLLT